MSAGILSPGAESDAQELPENDRTEYRRNRKLD